MVEADGEEKGERWMREGEGVDSEFRGRDRGRP